MKSPISRRRWFTSTAVSLAVVSGSRWNSVSADEPTPASKPVASDADAPTFTETKTSNWRFGMSVRTPVTLTAGLGTFCVPMDWPEQTVTITSREIDGRLAQWQMRDLNESARQVAVGIPRMTANSTLEVELIIHVEKRNIVAPVDPSGLVIPQRISRDLKAFMGNSPNIDASHGSIRMLSRKLESESESKAAWDRVRLIYDTVREQVRYVEGPIRDASDALKDGKGDCEDMTSLFVALCRNAGVPARMVWVPDHCYPEFYLESSHPTTDGKAVGHWYPCQAAGSEAFGEMQEDRPILQKGDRFKVPEERQVVRYVAEFFRCDRRGNGSPDVRFIRESVPDA